MDLVCQVRMREKVNRILLDEALLEADELNLWIFGIYHMFEQVPCNISKWYTNSNTFWALWMPRFSLHSGFHISLQDVVVCFHPFILLVSHSRSGCFISWNYSLILVFYIFFDAMAYVYISWPNPYTSPSIIQPI